MQFGNVSFNPDVNWSEWTWDQFMDLYNSSLKGEVTDTPEEVAKVLGVKVPVQKPKKDVV